MAEAAKKKGGSKMMLIIIGAVVLLGGGGGAAVMMKGKKDVKPKTEASVGDELKDDTKGAKEGEEKPEGAAKEGEKKEGGESKEGAAAATPKPSLIFKFHGADPTHEDKFAVNLIDPKGRLFLNAGLQLEASSAKALAKIEESDAPLRDAIIMLMSSKTRDEIDTPTGKERFKRELQSRIDGILDPKTVSHIYITDWFVMAAQ